ncbi:LytTR family DNA-binding domain-containing protein [Asticcacaulis sp. DXS10W]|uniref:LytTR family DNA-binding domain-containing protein n=1 Tax=Asticcacaulis currens TaxID=2984210 RepID=A0ABT5IDZ8_9CAUL|nr:LytTR family DNA-binding domain-containing protein [Asticcacaulis currens]MDC7694379.1 LytTR family DNA-binding domain-containing protein [Asticcacaulis currens]
MAAPVMKVLLVAIGAGLLFGLIGPFGTFGNLPLISRIGYWVVLMGGGALFFPVTYEVLKRRLPLSNSWCLMVTTVSLIGTIPMMGLVWLVTRIFYGEGLPFSFTLYGFTALIALPTVIIHHFMHQFGSRQGQPDVAVGQLATDQLSGEASRRNVLLERLSGVRASEILCMQVEDHYVRVYTSAGSQMVLMRFSDAVAAMQGVDGVRVHRSWWVARMAVTKIHKKGRKLEIELSNALLVPVSREGKKASLAARLWNANQG